jgi:hypothetical protein
MAEGKKSFVLYSDQRTIIDMLSDEKAGQLLKHMFAYVNDENPKTNDPLILLAFEPIKLQMKRDLIKWEKTKSVRSDAGKASAEARKLAKEKQQTLTNSTNVNFVQQSSTNSTVNVNDTVNVNVNDIKEIYRAFANLSLSFSEFEKLEAEYDKTTIDMVLDSIENYKDNKKYKSLYLTAKNWLSKEPKKRSVVELDEWEQDFKLGDVMPNGATLTADVISHHEQTGLSYKRLAGL